MSPSPQGHPGAVASFWWAPGAMVWRLMLVAALAVALAGGLGAFIVAQASGQETVQRLAAQQNDEVEMLARLLAGKVEQSQRLLASVAAGITPSMVESPAALEAQLHQGLQPARFFDSLLVARSNGLLSLYLRHGRVQQAGSLDPAERDGLRRALADGKPQVSEPIAEHTSEARLLFTMPLHREDGSLFGVIGGTLRLQSQALLPPALALPLRADSRLVVFTRDGTILAHSQPARILGQVRDEPGLAQAYADWQARAQAIVDGAQTQLQPAHIVSMAGMPLPQWMVARVSDVQVRAVPGQGGSGQMGWMAAALLLLIALGAMLCMAWVAQPLAVLRHRAPQLLQAGPSALEPWPRAAGEVDALVDVLRSLGHQRAQLREQHTVLGVRFQAILDHAPVGIVIIRSGVFELLNRQACHMLGYSLDALRGQHASMLHASVADYQHLERQVRQAFTAHGAFNGDVCFQRKDGGPVWVRVQGHALGQAEEGVGSVWILEDMTAEREALRQQDWGVRHDPLTLLANRAGLELRLQNLLAQRQEGAAGGVGVLLFLDLDHFAVLNDEAGHEAGNDVLRHVARLIETQVRQIGWAARVGGDEFAVVLPGCTHARGLAVAEQLRAALQDWEPAYQGRSFTLGASIGVVMLDTGLANVTEVLHAADMACYAAKRAGRNRVVEHAQKASAV